VIQLLFYLNKLNYAVDGNSGAFMFWIMSVLFMIIMICFMYDDLVLA